MEGNNGRYHPMEGSLGKVHLGCLEKWLNVCGRQQCELCNFEFLTKRRRRFSVVQSIRIWAMEPTNRVLLRADLIAVVILTSLTAVVCSFSALTSGFLEKEGQKLGLPPIYTRALVVSFQIVLIFGYAMSVNIILRDHVVSWYRWWNTTHRIVIEVEDKRDGKV